MWRALRERVVDPLADLVFPRTCLVCSAGFDPLRDPHSICPACRKEILDDPFEACPRCAGSIGLYTATEEGCPRCRDDRFSFDRAFRLGPYAGELRDVVLRMKDGSGEALAETVGHLWAAARAEQFRATGCTVVVPVPLHWRKRFVRGYNPAAALARSIAAELGLGYRNLLRRTRNTPRQTDQTPEHRRTNVKGAFAVAPGQKAQDVRVLLVDDVLTSGSTCSAAAEVMRAAGAAQVTAAVLAHR